MSFKSRKFAVVAVLIALSLASCSSDETAFEKAVVVEVTDGDTIKLDDGRKVRYIGVDTPEITKGKTECFGEEARDFNVALVLNKEVSLEYDQEPEDRFGRTLAYVWIEVGSSKRMVNEELLRKGYGKLLLIAPNYAHKSLMESAEAQAKADGAGLWSQCK